MYRLLSDRCSLRVESAANPLRCCLSWRRACEVRRGGPAGRVRGHRMTGGTPKEVHWTAEQQKRPQRTYRGRKRRETAAQGSTTGRCFRPIVPAQNVVFVNPPKDSPESPFLVKQKGVWTSSFTVSSPQALLLLPPPCQRCSLPSSREHRSLPTPIDGWTAASVLIPTFNRPCPPSLLLFASHSY